jgi:hypothetical protein
LESGIEAFVRLEPCDILHYFGGWQVLSCALVEPERRRGAYLEDLPTRYSVEQGNVSDLVCTDSAHLNEELLGRVASLDTEIGRNEPPRVFLLWENSD